MFNNSFQFTKVLATLKTMNIRDAIINKIAYVVLTYLFDSLSSPKAADVANLFFKPLPKPISKKLNQLIIEFMVNHMPYCVGLTKLMVIGIKTRPIRILNPFISSEAEMFFFTKRIRSFPPEKKVKK